MCIYSNHLLNLGLDKRQKKGGRAVTHNKLHVVTVNKLGIKYSNGRLSSQVVNHIMWGLKGQSPLPLIYHLYRYVDAWNSTHIVQIKIRPQCLQTLYCKVGLLSACTYHFRWQWFMRLIASMHLFNEATPAITLTGTHVDYVVLWLMAKSTMLFLFWKHCLRASHL